MPEVIEFAEGCGLGSPAIVIDGNEAAPEVTLEPSSAARLELYGNTMGGKDIVKFVL